MSLYEYCLFSVFQQLINYKIKYETLDVLPEDILNNLNKYLIHMDDSCVYFKEEHFYTSLKLKHFVFAKFFLKEITNDDDDVTNVLNDGLYYVEDIEATEFLINHGANDWDNGLLGSVYNNDMNMIRYFIGLGANDFNNAMLQSITSNNIILINYFIDLGADDFDGGLFMSTQMNNAGLINFFIKKGSTDFNGGLCAAAHIGSDDLIVFYINLGANDYMAALGCAIDNNNFNKSLIPPVRMDLVYPCIVGDSFLYFLQNTNFKSRSGININNLIPYLLNGYSTEQTLRLLMKLYTYNNDDDDHKDKNDPYYIAFGKMPSLNEKVIKNETIISIINNNKSTTFYNIKKYHLGFHPSFIDRLYFPDIIELNIYKSPLLPKDKKDETKKRLWNELMIIKAIVNFYDRYLIQKLY